MILTRASTQRQLPMARSAHGSSSVLDLAKIRLPRLRAASHRQTQGLKTRMAALQGRSYKVITTCGSARFPTVQIPIFSSAQEISTNAPSAPPAIAQPRGHGKTLRLSTELDVPPAFRSLQHHTFILTSTDLTSASPVPR